jgi:hypothetical protein
MMVAPARSFLSVFERGVSPRFPERERQNVPPLPLLHTPSLHAIQDCETHSLTHNPLCGALSSFRKGPTLPLFRVSSKTLSIMRGDRRLTILAPVRRVHRRLGPQEMKSHDTHPIPLQNRQGLTPKPRQSSQTKV